MKKSMMAAQLAMAFVCVQGGAALAAPGAWGDGPGCGLGQLVFASQPKTIMHQVLGATTNGTGMQTLGSARAHQTALTMGRL